MLQILAFTLLLATAGEPQTAAPAEPPAVTAPAPTQNTAPTTTPAQPEMICRTVREDGAMGSNMSRRRRVCTPRPVAVAPTGSEPTVNAPASTEPAPNTPAAAPSESTN